MPVKTIKVKPNQKKPKKAFVCEVKLKDKVNRNALQIDINRILGDMPDARYLYVVKVPKANNRIKIFVESEHEK